MGSQFSWQNGAACKGVPSYIFFPDEKRPKKDEYAGKTYHNWCCSCIVRIKCREFAYLHDMQGIWGDSTESERAAIQSPEDRRELREYKGDNGDYWPLYGHA
jgi:hypothetical protein